MGNWSADLPVSAEEIERDLKTPSFFSVFSSPAISRRFERDNRHARVSSIRLAAVVGLPAYLVFCLLDSSILPDLGPWPALFRLGVVLPVALFVAWKVPSFEPRFREAFIAVAVTGAMLGPACFMALSRAPLAPYAMLALMLIVVYADLTLRLRFVWACAFNGVTLVAIGATVLLRPDLPSGLAVVLFVSSTICAVFCLVANHQLEHAEGRAFLLGLKETLRFERLERERQTLSRLSLLDPLTGIHNRRAFDARMAKLCERSRATGRTISLLMIDLDHFKSFNDHYGHVEGDACLCAIANILRRLVVRADELIARLGGEEFAIVLDDDGATGVATGERLRRLLDEAAIPHLGRPDGRRTVTVSIGIATTKDGVSDPIGMLTLADQRLYAAKWSGRNAICAEDRRAA